jgi:putative addiction module component (TIGR02574 family)
MTTAARKVLDAALALDRGEREELVSALSESLDLGAVAVSPAWRQEIVTRIDELARGTVTPVTLDEVEQRISARLAR